MKLSKLAVLVPAVALLAATSPTPADARTKDIVKYGGIALGAAAIYSLGQQSAYGYGGGGYYYDSPGYYSYPSYNYGYNSYPSYSYYPSYGYYNGGGYYY